jgi:hypothetical protein
MMHKIVFFMVSFWVVANAAAQTGMKIRGGHPHNLSEQILDRGEVRMVLKKTSEGELRSALPPLIRALKKACTDSGGSLTFEGLLKQAIEAVTDAMVTQIKKQRADYPPCSEVEMMVEDLLAVKLLSSGQAEELIKTPFWEKKRGEFGGDKGVSLPIPDLTLLEDEQFSKVFSDARILWKQSRLEGVPPEERRRLQEKALLQLQLLTLEADARSHLAH